MYAVFLLESPACSLLVGSGENRQSQCTRYLPKPVSRVDKQNLHDKHAVLSAIPYLGVNLELGPTAARHCVLSCSRCSLTKRLNNDIEKYICIRI